VIDVVLASISFCSFVSNELMSVFTPEIDVLIVVTFPYNVEISVSFEVICVCNLVSAASYSLVISSFKSDI